MTLGIIKRTTPNFSFRIPFFDAPNWGREVERNFDTIDAVLFAATGFTNVKGVWANNTEYEASERVVDPADGSTWQCNVDHTSASTGTFVEDRTAHPTYWSRLSQTFGNRGQWTTATNYNINEFVYDDLRYGVVKNKYTSGASYDADVASDNILTLIDLRDVMDDAELQAANAAASASAAATSASQANTSKNDAATSASAANTSATNAASSASAAAGSATTAGTQAGNAAASASAANTSAGNAATSATNSANSATSAATQATNAANSATAAAGSATAASGSANAAASSASDAANSATNAYLHGGVPVGAIIPVYGNGTANIPGFIKFTPGFAVTSTYPQLRAFGLANGWATNGNGDPVMPNAQAPFLRGWISGQTGGDAGRGFGSVQQDATQLVTGKVGPFLRNTIDQNLGALSYVAAPTGDFGGSTTRNFAYIDFDNSRVVRTAGEERVVNITVTYYIKAYDAPVDTSTINLSQLLADIADVQSKLDKDASVVSVNASAAFDYTNIVPAGTKEFEIIIADPLGPTATATIPKLQLGTASGIQTTGYATGFGGINTAAASGSSNDTTGISMSITNVSSPVFTGRIKFRRIGTSNRWKYLGILVSETTATLSIFGGGVTLSGDLDRVRFTTANGSATFTGSVEVVYRKANP